MVCGSVWSHPTSGSLCLLHACFEDVSYLLAAPVTMPSACCNASLGEEVLAFGPISPNKLLL